MAPTDENSLYMMVGEIRSDVKKLLASQVSSDNRISSLERWKWTASGAAAFLGVFVSTAIAKVWG